MSKKKGSKLNKVRPWRLVALGVVTALGLVAAVATTSGLGLLDQRPVAAGQEPVIVAVGDLACEPNNPFYNDGQGTNVACQAQATSDLALRLDPQAVLVLGDEQYRSGTLGEFEASYDKSWGRLKAITHPVPGNHEYENLGAAGYFGYFGALAGVPELGYYSFDIGDWHVVALNANCREVGGCEETSAEEQWLRRDLAAHKNVCTMAIWHQPRFSSGLAGSDTAYQPFWQDLQDFHADVVLSGHDHDYERFAPQTADGRLDPNGPTQFVVGTGGESLTPWITLRPNSLVRDNEDYGVLKMTLSASSYSWQYITIKGAVKDAGSAKCVTQAAQTVAPHPFTTPQPTPTQ